MFSFHKPRVYRSTQGCCICKAKSSSSRFTDSKKYENDFMKCFQLTSPRCGEICNACVLLVKRFKRLPVGSNRHWGHVVDARVGPGLKSMTKFKKRKEESLQQQQNDNDQNNLKEQNGKISSIPEKFSKIFKKTKKKKCVPTRENTPGSSDELSPLSPTSLNSDSEENQFRCRFKTNSNSRTSNLMRPKLEKICKRKSRRPSKYLNRFENIGFLDDNLWKKVKSCCGIVYENEQIGALMLDYEICSPCQEHVHLFETGNRSEHMLMSSELKYGIVADHKKTDSKMIANNYKMISNTEISATIKRQTMLPDSNSLPITIIDNCNNSTNSIINNGSSSNISIHSNILPALKKHQLYFKRQMESARVAENQNLPNFYKTDGVVATNLIPNHAVTDEVQVANDSQPNCINASTVSSTISNNNNKHMTYLHKLKADSGKIIKHSLEKISNARLKTTELNVVKNLMKICNEKSAKVKPIDDKTELLMTQRNKPIDPTANKFSDNSSDSGYEESAQEQKTIPTTQFAHKGKVQSIVRPVILSNGIKLHVQPQNLVLAANLAGISQSSIQQQQQQQPPPAQILNGKIISQTDSGDNHAIYNNTVPPDSSMTVNIAGTSALTQMVHTIPAGKSLNQKILLLKTKYNNNNNGNNQSGAIN